MNFLLGVPREPIHQTSSTLVRNTAIKTHGHDFQSMLQRQYTRKKGWKCGSGCVIVPEDTFRDAQEVRGKRNPTVIVLLYPCDNVRDDDLLVHLRRSTHSCF